MNETEREKLLGYGPQGLALEVNPWQTKKAIESVLLYRGAIVAGWANVETTLNELSIRLSYMPEYQAIRRSYPHKRKSLANFLRTVFDALGPLQPFNPMANCVLERFEETADLRNLMAHGGMKVLSVATFQMYKSKSSDEITMLKRMFTEREMLALARRASRFSRAVQHLYHRLDQIVEIPPLDLRQ